MPGARADATRQPLVPRTRLHDMIRHMRERRAGTGAPSYREEMLLILFPLKVASTRATLLSLEGVPAEPPSHPPSPRTAGCSLRAARYVKPPKRRLLQRYRDRTKSLGGCSAAFGVDEGSEMGTSGKGQSWVMIVGNYGPRGLARPVMCFNGRIVDTGRPKDGEKAVIQNAFLVNLDTRAGSACRPCCWPISLKRHPSLRRGCWARELSRSTYERGRHRDPRARRAPGAHGHRRRWTRFICRLLVADHRLPGIPDRGDGPLQLPTRSPPAYRSEFAWERFTWQWYQQWKDIPGLTAAFWLSIRLALVSMILATIGRHGAGAGAGALPAARFRGRSLVEQVMFNEHRRAGDRAWPSLLASS